MIPAQDSLWKAGMKEAKEHQSWRARKALAGLSDSQQTYISITAHGSIIRVFLEVMGHPNPRMSLPNSYIFPVFFKSSNDPKPSATGEHAKPTPVAVDESCKTKYPQ
jgi:hypothetical protein